MDVQQLNDDLTKLLDEANGDIFIEVNGMETHIGGQMNKPGALMAAYVVVKSLEVQGFSKSFEESIVLLDALKSILNSKIIEN